MGSFKDSYVDTGGSNWVSADEKKELIADRTPFTITKVRTGTDTYQGKEKLRYFVSIAISDAPDEERMLGFDAGLVPSRDRLLDSYAASLDETGETEEFVLEKVSGSQAVILAFA